VETNLDDTSGELIGYSTARLWEAGALDVYTTSIQMKKNRPGVILSVLCREEQLEAVSAILFSETTTLGVRRWPVRREVLRRQTHSVATPWGKVEGKVGWLRDEARFSPEFESCRQIAEQHKVPLRAVYEAAQQAFDPSAVKKA
jgi:pyridinium-3,5-bisthiocarboxylic acid mononucleotide nickel chelatase